MASFQRHLPLSFSVERLLQRSEHTDSISNSSEEDSTPPKSIQQVTAPRNLVINAGFAAFPLPLNLPLRWNPTLTTSALNWRTPLFGLQPVPDSFCSSSATSKRSDGNSKNEESDDEDILSSPEENSMALGVEASTLQKKADTTSGYRKKKRTTFTSSQLQQLENRFNQQKYLTKHDRLSLAQKLGLTEKHIKTWYQNRRTKWKKECTDEIWSRERESAATVMYTQHLKFKSLSMNTSPNCTVF